MTYDPMRDLDEERDAYDPFRRSNIARGSPTPYVVGGLALAILAVMGLNLLNINEANIPGQEKQVTTESGPATGSSASYN